MQTEGGGGRSGVHPKNRLPLGKYLYLISEIYSYNLPVYLYINCSFCFYINWECIQFNVTTWCIWIFYSLEELHCKSVSKISSIIVRMGRAWPTESVQAWKRGQGGQNAKKLCGHSLWIALSYDQNFWKISVNKFSF